MGSCFSCFKFKDPPTAIISGSTVSDSETQRLAPRISNDQSKPASSESHCAAQIPAINPDDQTRASSSRSGTIFRFSDLPVFVSVPETTRVVSEGIPSSEGTSNSRVIEQRVESDRISPSEGSNGFVVEPSIAAINNQENEGISSSQVMNISSTSCSEKHLIPSYNEFYEVFLSSEDEDVCPTCLEDYDPNNPKITTECSHHFHLGCIYAWMERSSTCPVCSRVMVFNEAA